MLVNKHSSFTMQLPASFLTVIQALTGVADVRLLLKAGCLQDGAVVVIGTLSEAV